LTGIIVRRLFSVKETAERRRFKRFLVPHSTFAVFGPHFTLRAPIIDLGSDGLAFRYPSAEKSPDELLELDILFAKGSFYLGKVPVRRISDEVASERPFDTVPMRRSGVQFGQLTKHQRTRLEYFIQNYNEGEV
jgi:hypothetical protein